MNTYKTHIIYKISVFILVFALLTPAVVKFSHVFKDHKHNVCKNSQKTHFHEFNLDCDFYSFKLSTQFSFIPQDFELLPVIENHQIAIQHYLFVTSNKNTHLFKRGPPQLI